MMGSSRSPKPFDTITQGGLNQADIAHHVGKTLRFDRSGLVGTPHGTIKGDMTFHHASTQGNGRNGGGKTGFVSGIPDRECHSVREASE